MTGLPSQVFERIGGGEPAASTTTLSSPQPWFVQWATGSDGSPGPAVNEFTAMNYAAFYTAVTLVASTVASLPFKVYRKRADGGQDEVTDHPAADLLQREFNGNTAAGVGRETEVGHLLTWGNQYTQIVRARNGDLLELRPIGPDVVCVEANERNELVYEVRAYDRPREERPEATFRRQDVLHTLYHSFDGLAGMSTVRVAKGLLRTGLAQDRQAERFITKGMRAPGAMLLRDGSRFKTEAEGMAWRERFRKIHNGEAGDQEVVILEDGAKWQSLGVDPESAQLLESRRFTRGEVAGLFHIPPHLLGDVEKNTSWGSGIEELNIGFVVYCLLPILRKLEQERNRKLFDPRRRPDDRGLFVEHVLAGLLRGDTLKQSQAIREYMMLGLLMVNEARRLLGWNPIPGGNVRYFPLNMGRVDGDTGEDIPPPPPAEKPAPDPAPALATRADRERQAKLAAAFRKSLTAAVARCLRKEAAEAVKLAKDHTKFIPSVNEFYARHSLQVEETYATDLTAGFAAKHLAKSQADLLAAAECRPAELAGRVEACVQRWQTERVADLVAELSGEMAHA
jgi:HK97 family phage portal protein